MWVREWGTPVGELRPGPLILGARREGAGGSPTNAAESRVPFTLTHDRHCALRVWWVWPGVRGLGLGFTPYPVSPGIQSRGLDAPAGQSSSTLGGRVHPVHPGQPSHRPPSPLPQKLPPVPLSCLETFSSLSSLTPAFTAPLFYWNNRDKSLIFSV